MGFEYAGAPTSPMSPAVSALGYDESARSYFTKFTSPSGVMVGLVMIEDAPEFPKIDLPKSGAYGAVVLIHEAKGIQEIDERAATHGTEVLRPLNQTTNETGITTSAMHLIAPTGHIVALYESDALPEKD